MNFLLNFYKVIHKLIKRRGFAKQIRAKKNQKEKTKNELKNSF